MLRHPTLQFISHGWLQLLGRKERASNPITIPGDSEINLSRATGSQGRSASTDTVFSQGHVMENTHVAWL